MDDEEKMLIAPPQSPYRILGLPLGADDREINQAHREFFRKKRGAEMSKGKEAQGKLANKKERAKADAFCCEWPRPRMDLRDLKEKVENGGADLTCYALEHLEVFSDIPYLAPFGEDGVLDFELFQPTLRADFRAKGEDDE